MVIRIEMLNGEEDGEEKREEKGKFWWENFGSPCPFFFTRVLGWMWLNHDMRHKNITTVLVENVPQAPRYIYGITLHLLAYPSLLNSLGIDHTTFRKQLGVTAPNSAMESQFTDSNSMVVETDLVSFRCHRGKLERLLQEDQLIRWGNEVREVETAAEKIALQLKNGNIIKAAF